MILVELVYNLSLLVALSIVSGFLDKRYPRTTLTGLIVQGLLFGIVAIVGMIQPLIFSEGLIFDGRSVVISLSTLFFGPISGSIAGMMAIIFRVIQGGSGIVPGTLVVISSVIIGSIFHFQKKKKNEETTVRQLLYLGFAVHIVMLLMMFSLPFPTAISVIQRIGIPVILSYPLATVLIGKILSDQEVNFRIIENIKASELKFRTVADYTFDWEYWQDENKKFVYTSPSCERITGYTQDEFYSDPMLLEKIVHPEDSEYIVKHSMKVYSDEHKGDIDELEFRIVKKDGSIVNINHICRPIFDSNHKFLGRRVSNRDITDRKTAEQALSASEHLFHTLARVSPVGIFRTNPDGYTTYVNPKWSQLSCLSFEDALGYGWLNAVHPDDKEKLSKGWQESTKDQKVSYSEYRFLRPGGAITWVMGQAIPETNSENHLVGYIGTITDITERKRAEEELLKLKKAVENSGEVIFLTDKDGIFTFANPAFTSIYGFTTNEIIGKVSPRILSSGLLSANDHTMFWETLLSGKEVRGELINKRKDGTLINIEGSVTPIFDEKKKIIGFLGVQRDITERKQAEDILHESETKFRKLIASLPDGVLVVDNEGHIVYCNDNATKMFGYNYDDMLSSTIEDLVPKRFSKDHKALRSVYYSEAKSRPMGKDRELFAQRKDGSEFPTEIMLEPVEINNEQVILTIVRDITDRRRAEKELIEAKEKAERSDKLKTEFLAQMSHEIRSPMNAVLSFANLLRDDLGEKITHDYLEYFEGIEASGRRLIRTVDLLLNASEMQVGTYEPTFIKLDLIKGVIEKIKHNYKKLIDKKGLVLNIFSNISEAVVVGDEYSIYQIFVNLIDNAITYTTDGSISVNILAAEKEQGIKVTIEDSGIGMSEEFMSRMFQPFTQEDRGYSRRFDGNGLGLSLVKKYCALNHIIITVESMKGKGSKFTLIFTDTK